MPRSLVKALWIVAGLIWSGLASAVGFGGAKVLSALGQPLKVEISLSDISARDESSLSARLATPDAYAAAGIDYPYSLAKLKFEIDTSSGTPRIKVTSKDPVNDPFVSLLVELNWSSGRLLREYTFLIDPPGYKSAQPKPEAVAPIEPVAPTPPAPAPAPVSEVPAAPVMSSASAPVATEAAPAPVSVPAPVAAPAPAAAPAVAASAPMAATAAAVPITAPASAPVAAAASAVPVTEVAVASAPAVTSEMAASAPVAAETQAASAPVVTSEAEAAPAPASEQVEPKQPEPEKTITVKRGDTLTKIADQIKEPDVTLEQMLVALYRANVNQFDGKNMNRLRAGKILQMPSQAVLEKLSQTEAVKQIHIQTVDWNAYRQKLAAASTPAPEQAPKQEASGTISTTVADKTPPVKESAKEVLKLSKGEAPGDKVAAAGKAMTPQEKANAKQEETIAKGKAQQETGQRTAMLEKNVQEMQKLVELKQQGTVPAAPAQPAKPAESAVVAVPAQAAPAQPPAKPVPAKPKKIILPPPAPPAPTLMDTIMGMVANPLYLGGLGAIVLAGGLGFYLKRKRGSSGEKKPKEKKKRGSKQPDKQVLVEEVATEPEEVTDDVPAAVASTVAGQEIASIAAPAHKPAEEDEVDPISEADLFLNFGRDVQAEEILKDALGKNPSNRPVQLKLLSIYANRKDTNAFSGIARQIKDSGDKAAWEQAAALGREVDPGNPEYGGTGGAMQAAAAAASTAQEAPAPDVDIDIGFNVPMDFDVTTASPVAQAEASQVMDFDISGSSTASTDFDITGNTASAPAAETGAMSFDITGGKPEIPQKTEQLDFDVTGSQPKVALDAEQLDFDVTGSQPKVTLGAEQLDFDVTTSHPNVLAEAAGEAAPDNEFVMDFDISAAPGLEPPPAPAPDDATLNIKASQPEQAPAMDLDLGGINLDLGSSITTLVSPVADAKNEQWNEVATKLDLARAYQEMGDGDGAREILNEVLRDGDDQQKEAAQALMQQL